MSRTDGSSGLFRWGEAIRLRSVDSTQSVGRRLAREGAPEGTIVIADEQTAGHGREGRVWHSPAGTGLYASILLRPRLEPSLWIAFTSLTALALAEALDTLREPASDPILIKWPNDLFGRAGKLAGILAETEGPALVIGLGLNLTTRAEEFPSDLRGRASSLLLEGFDPVPSTEAVVAAFHVTFTAAHERWLVGPRGFLAEGLRQRSLLAGRTVHLTLPGPSRLEGIAADVGECGELILETAEGRRTVVSGEVEAFDRPGADSAAGACWRRAGAGGARRP